MGAKKYYPIVAENKKSFIAYSDWKNVFDELPDEEAGKLIKHIFSYVNDENPKSDSILINAVFANIKSTLKRDLQKWDKQLKQRSEAGKKSADSRSTKSNDRSTLVNETERNSTDSVSVSVSVNDSVNVNVKKEGEDNGLFIPISNLFETLSKEKSWHDSIYRVNKLQKGTLSKWLKDFVGKLETESCTGKTITDAKSHFSRWLKIELTNQAKLNPPKSNRMQTKL